MASCLARGRGGGGGGGRSAEDAANDIRAFQLAVDGETLRTAPNILLANAIGESHFVRDAGGHPVKLVQARQRARIDPLQASVIALGLGGAPGKRRKPGKVWIA